MTKTRGAQAVTGGGNKPRPLWRQLLDRLLWVVLAVLCYLLLEILMPAWPCPYPHYGEQVSRTLKHIREVESLAYGFRQVHRRYPISLAQLAGAARNLADRETFEDGWGRALIYNFPGRVNTHAFDLYSKGRNGIDDGGRGDDITNWAEPEPLYYAQDHHRGWLNSTLFDVGSALVVGWLIWSLLRWRHLYYPAWRRGRPRLGCSALPRWLGPALVLVVSAAVFLYFPRVKAEYYYWRWSRFLARPPGGPHTNVDDAAETLIYMGHSAAPVVAAKLTDPRLAGLLHRPLRERTVRLLGLIGDPSVVPTLRDLLLRGPKDPFYVPHPAVAQALRRLGDRSVVWLLLDDINRRKGLLPFRSAKALELLTWHNFGDLTPDLPPEELRRRVAAWNQWWQENQERPESEWLRQGVEQAIAQLTSDDLYLRASAIRRLRRITRMRFFCEYYMSLQDRQAAAVVWQRWWQKHRERFRYADFDTVDRRFRTVDRLDIMEW